MRCPNCNAWVTPDLVVCPECGARLGADPPASEVAGASAVDRYRRQIAEDQERFRRDRQQTSREYSLAPGEAVAASPGAEVEDGLRGLGLGLGDAQPMPPFERAAAEEIRIEAQALGVLNPLLLHAGFSPLRGLAVSTSSDEGLAGMRLQLAATPPVLQPLTVPLADLGSGGALEPPAAAPDLVAFEGLDEAARGQLELSVLYEDTVVAGKSLPVTVQTANEWIALEGVEAALACAVTPNAPAVVELVSSIPIDFAAYQSGDRETIMAELIEIYAAIWRVGLSYIGVPPSFERTGQKILFPDQVLARRRGCCIDIAVLTASLLERAGYNPLIAVNPGHAFVGVWMADIRAKQPLLRDGEAIRQLSADEAIMVWNSTTYFERDATPQADGADGIPEFQIADSMRAAIAAGSEMLSRVEYIIDVAACRDHGFKPIPRSVS